MNSTLAELRIFDLSHTLHPDVQTYPGDPVFTSHAHASIGKDGYNVHTFSMGSHTGTHVDAPFHFFQDGKTIDQLPLSIFIGTAVVIDLTHKSARQKITWEDLAPYSHRMKVGVILLLRTGWSEHWCTPKYFDHPFLDKKAAERIIMSGVRAVGVDTLNPDETPVDGTETQGGFGVHETILGAGGIIAENLTNLASLGDPDMIVSFVPLNIQGSDGSPVRAFAWKTGNHERLQ